MSSLSFTVPAKVPSILGELDEVPFAQLALAQNASLSTVHAFPGHLDLDKFRDALGEVTRLYPIVCGRLGRRALPEGSQAKFETFVSLTGSPLEVEVVPAADALLPHPFPTQRVAQVHLDPYVDMLDPSALTNNPTARLLTLRVTRFESHDVLGICWAHTIGDGAALNSFTAILSRVYKGEQIPREDWPVFVGHVQTGVPSEQVCEKWDRNGMWPVWEEGKQAAIMGGVYGLIEISLSKEEIALLQSLARGEGDEGWVSEQDAMSSYCLNLMAIAGVEIDTATNAVNYRSLIKNDARFPAHLPRLVANVSQLISTAITTSTSSHSLKPIAHSLRATLTQLRAKPDSALDWLSVRALRNQMTEDQGLSQAWSPNETEVVLNSNWRYDWNYDFGFPKEGCAFHTRSIGCRYLRVFGSNDGTGAELSWKLPQAQADRVLEELAKDEGEGWARWK